MTEAESFLEVQQAASRDLERLAYTYAYIADHPANADRTKKLIQEIRDGVAAAVACLPTSLEYTKTPLGVVPMPTPIVLNVAQSITASQLPPTSTPLSSIGALVPPASPQSTAETVLMTETQFASKKQPNELTPPIENPQHASKILSTAVTTPIRSCAHR